MPTLFTIGHSNTPLEHFVGLLKQHAIEVLVDVRSAPRSKYVAHFDKESLQNELPGQDIKYLYLGRQLGGRPENEAIYDDQGRALYYQMAESESFLAGIQRLESWLHGFRVAIMCCEEDPEVCHRHLLVGRVMAARILSSRTFAATVRSRQPIIARVRSNSTCSASRWRTHGDHVVHSRCNLIEPREHFLAFDLPRRSWISLLLGGLIMPRGDKSKYTDKQKRKAEHIEEGYRKRGTSKKTAERIAWATVNKESGGGNKSGSGRGVKDTHVSSKKGGRIGGAASAARPKAARVASAKKAAATRKRRGH